MTEYRVSHLKVLGWTVITQAYVDNFFYYFNLGDVFGTWKLKNALEIQSRKYEILYGDEKLKDFVVMYGCNDHFFGLLFTRYAWLLTRSKFVDAETYKFAQNLLMDSVEYDTAKWWVNPNENVKDCEIKVEPSYQN